MYGVKNIEKFVRDYAFVVADRAEGILARAKAQARHGLVSNDKIEIIMADKYLTATFHEIAMSDPTHLQIGFEALMESKK